MPPALLASRTLPRVRPCLRSLARPAPRCLHASASASASPNAPPAMDADVRAVVEATHATPTQAVICIAGGGSQALGWLLSVPGASGTVLEARVPYARESMVELLGTEPASYSSADTAQALALAAYRRALRLAPLGADVAGVALAGALASAPLRRGAHVCHVATHTARGAALLSLTLSKGARGREAEDALSSRLLLRGLAQACGAAGAEALTAPPATLPDEAVSATAAPFTDPLAMLLAGAPEARVLQLRGGCAVAATGATAARVLLPGSFNPLHAGHVTLLAAAAAACGGAPAAFELSVRNADKPPLPRAEVERRVQQLAPGDAPMVLTDAPLFVDKARLMPGTVFVVGVDTAARIVMPKYYGDGSEDAMRAVLREILDAGCSFLVAGRVMDGVFVDALAVKAPTGMEGLFRALPAFRRDISSTELRAKAAAEAAAAGEAGQS